MRRLAIVGLGLIGGSLGLAVRRHRPDVQVIGIARRESTAARALALDAVHHASTDVADIAGAEVVVLACPLAVQARVLEDCVPHLKDGARVTDVGSVKGSVVRHALRTLTPERNPFLGGHPMAGKEVGGIENAEADLFAGRVWAFTPAPRASAQALGEAVVRERAGRAEDHWPRAFKDFVALVRDVGAVPVSLTPETHDRYVALISHVPFLLSAALLDAAGASPAWEEAKWLASSGFRDATRLGAGDPAMYAAIVEQNRDAVLDGWSALHEALDRFEVAMTRGEPETLRTLLEAARRVRRDWVDATRADGG